MTEKNRRRLEQIEAAMAAETQSPFEVVIRLVSPDGSYTDKMLSELMRKDDRATEETAKE